MDCGKFHMMHDMIILLSHIPVCTKSLSVHKIYSRNSVNLWLNYQTYCITENFQTNIYENFKNRLKQFSKTYFQITELY